MGVGYEFEQRPDGLPGLQKTYHLPLTGAVKTMDLGLLYRALAQDQVDMVAGNSTDGALSVLPVTILQDDKHFFPPYDAAIVVRNAALAEFPGLEAALRELEGKLDTRLMQRLNYEVDAKHRPVPQIAAEVLQGIER
jgi:osmoprotectant transport system substrate-binding protein